MGVLDMDLPAQTVADMAQAFDIEIPAATQAPNILLAARQDAMATCGFWSFSDRDIAFSEFLCDTCTTSSTYHGCKGNFKTTCYDASNTKCDGSGDLDDLATCCTQSTWTNCVTATSFGDKKTLTAYQCWAGLNGGVSIFSSPFEKTVIKTKGDETVTSVEPTKLETSKVGDNADQTQTSDPSSGKGNNSGGGGGSSTNTGAIVGGVIGGIALILLVAFGIWFMRNYKRKHAVQAGAEPYRGSDMGGYQQQGPVDTSYYGGYQQPVGAGMGYQLPPEQKPGDQIPLAEMPEDHNRRPAPAAELQ